MKKEEYKECKYIQEEMRFLTFDEFKENAEAIRNQYQELENKIFYKWYVYAHTFSIRIKDRIWEYLNFDISYSKLTTGR